MQGASNDTPGAQGTAEPEDPPVDRRRWQGTATIVRFNWPKYAAVAALAGAASLSWRVGAPDPVRRILLAGAAVGVAGSAISLAATWWVYDHRRVHDLIPRGLASVGSWASVHAEFDDPTPDLARGVGHRPDAVVTLRLPSRPARRGLVPVDPEVGRVGLASGSLDTAFVTFAAHELRDRAHQRVLFADLARVLRPGGRLVLTEHLRDRSNLAVYGPAAFHFQPARTWIDRAAEAGLQQESDTPLTPFVHRLVWTRGPR
ncbi:MAG: class I SAM-dependent methyltransferase [Iamia sp.]